jgi:hypothetical protein
VTRLTNEKFPFAVALPLEIQKDISASRHRRDKNFCIGKGKSVFAAEFFVR